MSFNKQIKARTRATLIFAFALAILLALNACSSGPPNNQSNGSPAPQLTEHSVTAMKLLVIGGSSGVGLETVKLALKRGHAVTLMSRTPEKSGLTHASLTLYPGSILDSQATNTALKGQDAVVIAIGMGPTREPVSLFSQGARNVLAGMSENGIERLIAVTGIGVAETRGHGGFFYDNILQPLALKTIYADKEKEESLIRASGTQWTLLRPGFLTDEAPTGNYRVINDITGVTAGDITRADTAHYIVAALEQQLHIEQAPLISE